MTGKARADHVGEMELLRQRVAELERAQEESEWVHAELDRKAAALRVANESLRKEIADRKEAEARLVEQAARLAQSEDALQEKTRILQSILNSIADGIVVVDQDGQFLIFNPAGERLVGVGVTDAKPDEWSKRYGLYKPDGKTPHPPDTLPLARAMRNETVREQELFVRNPNIPDGVMLSVNASPLIDTSGECRGGVCVFRDITRRKKNERKLKAEERLLRKMLDLRERERKLIAYDIHDGFVQYVVGAQMAVQAVWHDLEIEDSDCLNRIKAISELLVRAIDEGRRMISELRPLIIDEEGIVAAVEYLIAEKQDREAMEVTFTSKGNFDRISPLLVGAIFRIVQEALANVQRHAEVPQATVRLDRVDQTIVIEVCDQGVGFDPQAVVDEHFGLRSIRERARLFLGKAFIESTPGAGTQVMVELPVTEAVE